MSTLVKKIINRWKLEDELNSSEASELADSIVTVGTQMKSQSAYAPHTLH